MKSKSEMFYQLVVLFAWNNFCLKNPRNNFMIQNFKLQRKIYIPINLAGFRKYFFKAIDIFLHGIQ